MPSVAFLSANKDLNVRSNLPLAKLRLEQGREKEATEILEGCVKSFKDYEYTTEPLLHIETLLHLTSLYANARRLDEAQKMSEVARQLAETLKGDAGLAMALQGEGALFLAKRDGQSAEEAYLRSLTLWEKAGWPYYQAKSLVAYSEAIVQTNPEESRKRLQQAAEIFRKLGAKRDLGKAEARLTAK
jgi:tetratricopeptide (TPR) repeat protein